MFCPNCGTQNEDSATACQKCGFNLKGAAAPKFKGTMLMVNAPPTAPRPAQQPGGPVAGAPAAKAASPAGKPVMKATMIGVAPPSPGAVAPPAARVPAPAMATPAPAVPAPAPQAAAPYASAPVHAPAPFDVAAPHAMAPSTPGALATSEMDATLGSEQSQSPVVASPHAAGLAEPVNPLGGTMVAGQLGGPGYGAAPAYAPAAPYAPAPNMPSTAAAGGGVLAATTPAGFAPGEVPPLGTNAPQAAQGWGQPPAAQAPIAAPGFGGPPAGYSPYGATPGALAPGGHPGYPMSGVAAPHGPIGKTRNPIMVVVLTYVTCGLYGLLAMLSMVGELKAFRQKNDINPILFLLPVIGLLEMIKLPAKVLEAKRMAGVPNAQEPNVILYLFFGFYFLPADLNEVWQAASARQGIGALPHAGM